jgi:hypothetical protein
LDTNFGNDFDNGLISEIGEVRRLPSTGTGGSFEDQRASYLAVGLGGLILVMVATLRLYSRLRQQR